MDQATKTQAMKIELVSPAFGDGQMIPQENTCDGRDISPELQWAAIPDETRSLALIVDDPDAPSGTFVHWVLYNLPIDRHELTENMPHDETLPNGAPRASTISAGSATGAPARRAARTGTTSRSTPSTRISTCRRARPRPLCWTPWATISSPRVSSWAGTRGKEAIDDLRLTIYYFDDRPQQVCENGVRLMPCGAHHRAGCVSGPVSIVNRK